MALVKCPHCNSVVSDKAVKCPHCGYSLSKSTIIQHENNVFAIAGKSLFAIAILVSAVMCILPLFTNIYGRGWAPAFGYYCLVTYVLVGYGMIAGVLSIGLAINGIIRLCKYKESSWKYWLFALIYACVSAYGVFLLVDYNEKVVLWS